jgi:hypothetical protein
MLRNKKREEIVPPEAEAEIRGAALTAKSSKSPRRRHGPGRDALNVTAPRKKRAGTVERSRRTVGAA